MAEVATTLPKVEDIDIDGADGADDEVVTGEDGNPVKLTVSASFAISLRSVSFFIRDCNQLTLKYLFEGWTKEETSCQA